MERRRFLRWMGLGSAAAVGAAAGHVGTALPAAAAMDNEREDAAYAGDLHGRAELLWSVDTDEPAVAFTFDDGPNPELTPVVLDLLARFDARATFFLIGRSVETHPALARRLVAEGHEVANHSWSHENPAVIGASTTRTEIRRAQETITSVTGAVPRWYRPPRGMVTGAAVRHAHQAGLGVALWSVTRGGRGVSDTDVGAIRDHLVAALTPGAVVDLHDGLGRQTFHPGSSLAARLRRRRDAELAALPDVLRAAAERGFRLVTLSDLAGRGGPSG